MALTSAQVTVGATQTALNTVDPDDWTKITIKNGHATDALMLGPTGVTTGNGFSLAAGATVTLELEPNDALFGLRGAAADITAYVLRVT